MSTINLVFSSRESSASASSSARASCTLTCCTRLVAGATPRIDAGAMTSLTTFWPQHRCFGARMVGRPAPGTPARVGIKPKEGGAAKASASGVSRPQNAPTTSAIHVRTCMIEFPALVLWVRNSSLIAEIKLKKIYKKRVCLWFLNTNFRNDSRCELNNFLSLKHFVPKDIFRNLYFLSSTKSPSKSFGFATFACCNFS